MDLTISTIEMPKQYRFNYDNINTVDDIKTIFKAFKISISEDYVNFKDIPEIFLEKISQ